jgi:hypothetical protein
MKLLSVSVYDLKQSTTAAGSVDEDMLRCAWNELDYRIGICRVTKAHTWNIRNLVIAT